jgi:carboxymethylenebutenolidase
MVSRLGGTKPDPAVNSAAARADITDVVADLKATIDYLKKQPFVKPAAIGVTGFCLGGGYALEIAFASPDIKAAVPYYGSFRPDLTNELPKLQAAVLALYGGNDTFTRPLPVEAFRAAGKTVEVKVYAGAGHAFFNDTRPATQPGALGYNAEAAVAAWPETLAWFRKYLA